MSVTYLYYEVARARQQEDRRHAAQRRRVLAATRARTGWPHPRRRFTARPGRAVSAGA